jgi:GntR family transcriptional repressor for pyruvate dehydrogenase complex
LIPQIRPARRRNLSQEIVDQMLELIAASAAPEYRTPPERALCEQFDVSRTSVREALSALSHLGVLEKRGKAKIGLAARARAQLAARSHGTSAERELVSDPLEVRRMLEPETAFRAAKRVSERDLSEIADWLRLMEEGAARNERVVEYDSAFHVAIARATGNKTLVQLISALTDALRESRELSFRPREAAETALAGHREILDALRTGNAPAARRAMKRHLDQVERLLRASFEPER